MDGLIPKADAKANPIPETMISTRSPSSRANTFGSNF